ncbi:hypothetical protein [Fimbriiglobus ruber]|uniref:Uncharacterized protein n=1 Tax=Fimbriiglobus ruber TaxID=1908690 RepID=A0A225D997_9BACT|nr:hypothetical protein [Fimbriiglobus ruber]OWK38032.1 hypothetical protein FRUB_07152 [Fimbriiglobus ruber]
MSLDRQLVDSIKANFARKSSAQLWLIAHPNNHEDWSPEAVVAAGEVLDDRADGYAHEPAVPQGDDPPPPSPYDAIGTLALFAGLGFIGLGLGVIVIPGRRSAVDDPVARDQPVSFGSQIAWLAVRTSDTANVATTLDLRRAREAAWKEGIAAAYQSSVFVSPPVGEWTLVVGAALFPPTQVGAFVKPLLELLSRRFGEAQYFCTHQSAGLHVWAKARGGQLVRGYGWLDNQDRARWDEGPPTKQERYVGLRFADGKAPTIEGGGDGQPTALDESCVSQLACLWSIDPTALSEEFKEPVMGLSGQITWGMNRIAP